MQLDILKMEKEFEFKRWLEMAKLAHQSETQKLVARTQGLPVELDAEGTKFDALSAAMSEATNQFAQQMAALTQQIQQVSKIATAPRELVRDPKTGRPVGSRIVVD